MKNTLTNGAGNRHARLLLTMAAAFFVATYLHSVSKALLVEKNFADFAHYHFYSTQIGAGANVYALSGAELGARKAQSSIPVHIAGRPVYAPVFFLAFRPLAALPFWPANLLWMALNHLALAGCVFCLARIANRKIRDGLVSLCLACVIVFASRPLIEDMALGQVNIILLLFLIAAFHSQETKRHSVLTGALLGFALQMKPQLGLLWLFFMWKRRWALCAWTVAAYALLHAVAAGVCGWEIELAYWRQLFANLSATEWTMRSLSLLAFFTRVFSASFSPVAATSAYVVAALALGFLTFRRIRRDDDSNLAFEYAALICLMLLASPVTEEHHLVLANFSLVAAVCGLTLGRGKTLLLIAAFLLIAVRYSFISFSAFSAGLPAIINFGKTAGVFLLWWLCAGRLED